MRLLLPFYALCAGLGLTNGAAFELPSAAGEGFPGFIYSTVATGSESLPQRGAVLPQKAGKKDIADVNKEWRQTALQQLDVNAISSPVKNTFTTSFTFSPLKNKAESNRNPVSYLREMQANNLAPVEEVEVTDKKTGKKKLRVAITIPESRNPSSSSSKRQLSFEDL